MPQKLVQEVVKQQRPYALYSVLSIISPSIMYTSVYMYTCLYMCTEAVFTIEFAN